LKWGLLPAGLHLGGGLTVALGWFVQPKLQSMHVHTRLLLCTNVPVQMQCNEAQPPVQLTVYGSSSEQQLGCG